MLSCIIIRVSGKGKLIDLEFKDTFKIISAHDLSVYGRRKPATLVAHSVAVNLRAAAGTDQGW